MLKILILLHAVLSAPTQEVRTAIDNQVWIPFTKAWEANDGAAFNEVHSDNVRRINPGRLLLGEEYKTRNLNRMQGQPKDRIIEFSFETRTNNKSYAYEVGYYRITDTSETVTKQYVGRFHVALEKINGVWKIVQDWDTGEINDQTITPESVQGRKFIHFQ